jgi:hypothetical protein
VAVHVPVAPLQLSVESLGRQDNVVTRFNQYRGKDLMLDVLRSAGLGGSWRLQIQDTFKSSGGTPPVQIRRADKHGVIVWLKPGSNDSGVRCVLFVTKDHGTPQDVYDRLKAAVASPPDTADLNPLDEKLAATLIERVQLLNAEAAYGKDAYAKVLFEKLVARPIEGLPVANPAHLSQILDDLVERKLLYVDPTGAAYKVGRTGAEAVFHMHEADGTLEDVDELAAVFGDIVAPAAPPPPPSPTPAAPPVGPPARTAAGEALRLLETKKSKIQALLLIPEKATKLKARRDEILKQLEALSKELSAIDEAERKLMDGVDVDALAVLLTDAT